MEKKSLLNFLDEVSKEYGGTNFRNVTDNGRVFVVEEIIKEAGKRYVKQYLDVAAENAEIDISTLTDQSVDWVKFAITQDEDGGHIVIFADPKSIKNIEIDV